jgi:recombinational DNA repair protein (RecF pathway)
MDDAEQTDRCVVCGADTGIATAKPVSERHDYVEGAGQLCRPCAARLRAVAKPSHTLTRLCICA